MEYYSIIKKNILTMTLLIISFLFVILIILLYNLVYLTGSIFVKKNTNKQKLTKKLLKTELYNLNLNDIKLLHNNNLSSIKSGTYKFGISNDVKIFVHHNGIFPEIELIYFKTNNHHAVKWRNYYKMDTFDIGSKLWFKLHKIQRKLIKLYEEDEYNNSIEQLPNRVKTKLKHKLL